jgi:hypothetical protein
MARGYTLQRPRRPRVVGRKVVIVCEGRETEPGYFKGIRQFKGIPKELVPVIHPNATDPLSIVSKVINVRQTYKDAREWTTDDEAWAVFDGDEHMRGNPANWEAAILLAKSKGIHLAVSNPCFELWYLLHYQEQNGCLSPQEALRSLRGHIRDYEKSKRLWPEPLQSRTEDALSRARQLARRAADDGLPPHTNPRTGVCDLVDSLLLWPKKRPKNS